jgi:3-hydroxyisobutyrate dehydrogenase-like beta-hydroxyacid dehydrogenase
MASLPVIGWIGAGRMGVPMAGFVLKAGYPVVVFSRSPASRQKLVSRGARAAGSVAECARAASIVFCSLPDDRALREVALGPEGVLACAARGAVFVDTSTVSTEVSAEIDREATQLGIGYLRIPISGNAASAQRGEVTALVSGPESAWHSVRPVVEAFSQAQIYLGAGDEARYMKLAINLVVVATAQAMAEALALGRKAGLGWNLLLDTIAQSTIASPWLKVKAELMKRRDFTPTMTTHLILKDIDLMLAAAQAGGVTMPLTSVTRHVMQAAIDAGYGDEDYMAIIKLAERQAALSSEKTD